MNASAASHITLRHHPGVLAVYAWILVAALSGVSGAASEPPIQSASPSQPKASEPAPLASATKALLAPPNSNSASNQPKTAEPASAPSSATSHSWPSIWVDKFRDDPIVAFTLVLAISTILLGLETRKLRKAAQKQAVDTQDALQIARDASQAAQKSADASLLSLRPWVSCSVEVGGPLTFKESGDAHVPLIFTMKNVGKTPAMSVQLFFPKINLSEPGFELSIGKLQKLAEGSRGLPVTGGTIAMPGGMPINNPTGTLLFPNETFIERISLPISVSAAIESRKANNDAAIHFWPELIVLVTYVYHLASVRADTGFVFDLRKKDGTPFKIDEKVEASEVEIQPHGMWGGFAT